MTSWFSASTWQAASATTHRIWRLCVPYFSGDEKWRARVQLIAIVLLNLGSVYMLVLINDWYRVFYDALQNRDAAIFWHQIWRFCLLAAIYIVIAVYKFWLTQLLELHWRTWMTRHYLDRWLSHHAYYRLEQSRHLPANGSAGRADNPDQRIAEDLNLFTTYTISLSMGLLNSVVTLVSFVGILWGLSGNFSFQAGGHAITIPGFMVWMAVVYAAAGSVITHYIGRPLIGLNFNQQRTEADFRHHLVRVREYAESVALDRGESVERSLLGTRFASVFGATLRLLKRQKALTWFTAGFAQAAVIFPFIVAAPRFFSGAIQLGELIQISSAFGRVQDALGWFIDSYSSLAAWRATADRLTSFEDAVHHAEHRSGPQITADRSPEEGFQASGLEIERPAGYGQALAPLVSVPRLQVTPGDLVLVNGPSGSGKSTLFRTLAGIWPYGNGDIHVPASDVMFLPQRPYFPNGRLRDALAYPELASHYDDNVLKNALTQAELPQLAEELDLQDTWNQRLSGGEQQRLALARAFLKQPRWLLADEATSALDEATEARLYERLSTMVLARQGALVSIAHRPQLARFHKERWELVPQAGGGARIDTTPIPAA